jgi:hypothetical protein
MEKVEEKDINTNQVVKVNGISTSLVLPTPEADPLEELFGQSSVHETGLIALKPNKGATSFNSGVYGTGTLDSPLKAVILDVDMRKTLWPVGTQEVVKEIMEWAGRRPICSSKNKWNDDGVYPGGIKGVISKEIDEEAGDMVKNMVVPILEVNCSCAKCQWNEYGSAFSGNGKACRDSRLFLLYLPDEDLVCTLSANPTSLRNWKDYDITFQQKHWSTRVTEISTEIVDRDSLQYNVLKFKPFKQGKEVLMTTKELLAPILQQVSHNGQFMRMSKMYLQQFRSIEFEIPEFDDETGEAEF